jgi:hypothetical protein
MTVLVDKWLASLFKELDYRGCANCLLLLRWTHVGREPSRVRVLLLHLGCRAVCLLLHGWLWSF